MGASALACLLAGCFPTDPGCEFEGACQTGQARTCINFCADVATQEEVDHAGVECPLDPCDEAAYLAGAALCPEGTYCALDFGASDPSRLGTCAPNGPGFGDPCGADPFDEGQACSASTFCMDRACERGQAWSQIALVESDHGYCFPPVQEGESCDSNFVDARLFNRPREVFAGCRPCEPGTVCAPPGVDGVRRCIRLCERDGERRDELCGCVGQECRDRGPVFDPETGRELGRFFCDECIADNTRECTATAECCDDLAQCVPGQDPDSAAAHCCRPLGTACDPTASRQCCDLTFCDPANNTCSACATQGNSPTGGQPCCPGTEPILFGNATICQKCGFFDDKFLCSSNRLVARTQSGNAESVPIPNTNLTYRETVGNVGGDLDVAFRDVARVDYDLTQDHRAFFFQRRLSNQVEVGDQYFSLPLNDGLPRSEDIVTPDRWRSVQVYDSGRCSFFIPWAQVAGLVGTQLMTELLEPGSELAEGIDLDRLRGMEWVRISPRLNANPRYPGIFPLGPLVADDEADLAVRFNLNPILGCDTLTISVGFGLKGEPAIEPLDAGEDDLFTGGTDPLNRVRCFVDERDVDDIRYTCLVPQRDGDGPWRLEERSFPRVTIDDVCVDLCTDSCADARFCDMSIDPPGCVAACRAECNTEERCGRDPTLNDLRFRNVRCYIARDEYRCRLPVFDDPYMPGGALRMRLQSFPRRVRELEGTTDLVLRVLPNDIDFAVDRNGRDCGFFNWVASGFDNDLEEALWEFATILNDTLATTIGDSAIDDFGVPRGLVRACESDADCVGYLGGRRHRCVDVDGDADPDDRICDALTLEPRRVSVRPDGLEIVLADDERDPHFSLLMSLPSPLDNVLCGFARGGSTGDFALGLTERPLQRGEAGFAAGFCEADAVGCGGICSGIGAVCSGGAYSTLTGLPGPLPTSTCNQGECCPLSRFCGGECRDTNSDESNCGACGNTCAAGEICCGGSCSNLSSDRLNCGACRRTCGGTTPFCVGGECAGIDI